LIVGARPSSGHAAHHSAHVRSLSFVSVPSSSGRAPPPIEELRKGAEKRQPVSVPSSSGRAPPRLHRERRGLQLRVSVPSSSGRAPPPSIFWYLFCLFCVFKFPPRWGPPLLLYAI